MQRIIPITAMALALSASVTAAQSSAVATTGASNAATIEPMTAAPAPAAGPRLDQARAGFSVARAVASAGLDPAPQPSISRKRGVPQMIVGGAAILGGAIVGGDAGGIVSLAGLGYGLYGLYLYLQ
ncbi:MAG: hypothetical protein K8S21_12550 [Gemmatimonadetes bacterium]|nr:hypothetical protein [Gemmatimonadota bacterium]